MRVRDCHLVIHHHRSTSRRVWRLNPAYLLGPTYNHARSTGLDAHYERPAIVLSMPSNQQPPPSSDAGREQQRPTLPPIRDIFGRELSEAVPPQPGRPSASPQIPFHRLALTDDASHHRTGSPAPGSRGYTSSSHQLPPGYSPTPGQPGTGSHVRTPPVSSRPYAYGAPPPAGQQYIHHGHGQHPSYASHRVSRGEMPTGVYPYATPQSQYPGQPMPVASSSRATTEATPPERSTAARYECSYCHKGFTRPSSLKIHINTHTGERPFTCPHPGCGRSFSVQSNMRRHARVHERGSDSQADVVDEDLDEGDLSTSSK
ncbi:hypothetical protein DAEQUDRAFT_707717 [Daedalea quercina L-15889]|uniref:C2H2-type domain-containing protein n=1 Tax=Daedalea quercina L-15889 TaxID=1314783 RepID=A0A165RNF0_9APHY|nr:hypothetical protein DAEQUDRAFT_707717 [Daedalea quercina L-15889]